VFKFVHAWNGLSQFLITILKTMLKMSAFIIILLLLLFIFTIIGMDLFANTVRVNYDNEPIPYFSENGENISLNYSFADYNFDTFGDAAVTVFAVLANEDWSKIYFNHARVNGLGKSSVFFISLVIIGQMILLKLFLTIQLK